MKRCHRDSRFHITLKSFTMKTDTKVNEMCYTT